jgi:peptidoglycan/xylan/chitin deacetylase (PgdA/CDA1 family)
MIRLDGAEPQSRAVPDKTIALTFDDGPDPVWTPRILDLLAKYHAKATFFVVGSRVNQNPGVAKRIVAEGHEIGSHTFTHTELAAAPAWRRNLEMTLTANAIAGATGYQTTLFRPPFGSEPSALTTSDYATLQQVAKLGYVTVLSDVDPKDWKRPGVPAIVKEATPQGGKGAIVLMHDGGGDRAQTLAALDQLLPTLQKQGYKFTTVTEAIGVPSAMVPAPGDVKLRGDALRWTQRLASIVTDAMTWLLGIALVLSIVRLLVQLVAGTDAPAPGAQPLVAAQARGTAARNGDRPRVQRGRQHRRHGSVACGQ